MEAIASDATMLLPLLTDNASAMKALGDEAERTGQIMEKETIDKLKKASVEIDKFKNSATILTGTVLTKVVPALSILGQGLGFVGDYVGVSAANFLAFGRAVGTVLKAVVAPAISQMDALGLAIKAMGQAADGNISGAKKTITEAKDAAKDIVGEIKAIPSEINKAWDQLKNDAASGFEVLGESIDKRAKKIEENLNNIKGAATEANDEIKKTDNASSGVGSTDSATSVGGSESKTGDEPMGLNIERGKYESRNDFLRRREKARSANLLLQQKLQQQAMTGESAGITDQLINAAQGKPSKSDSNTVAVTESAKSLKNIERELTRTT
jgi:uncharacterized protein YukE